MQIVIVVLAAVLIAGGAGAAGFKLGMDKEVADQSREKELIEKAAKAAGDQAADVISKLRPKYTTINNKVQREIQTNTVYTECKLTPDGLQLANQALNGGKPVSKSELPQADGTK